MPLALALHDAGPDDVRMYESAPAIQELGVGINVLPHAVRELGLLEELTATEIPAIGPTAGRIPLIEHLHHEVWEPRYNPNVWGSYHR